MSDMTTVKKHPTSVTKQDFIFESQNKLAIGYTASDLPDGAVLLVSRIFTILNPTILAPQMNSGANQKRSKNSSKIQNSQKNSISHWLHIDLGLSLVHVPNSFQILRNKNPVIENQVLAGTLVVTVRCVSSSRAPWTAESAGDLKKFFVPGSVRFQVLNFFFWPVSNFLLVFVRPGLRFQFFVGPVWDQPVLVRGSLSSRTDWDVNVSAEPCFIPFIVIQIWVLTYARMNHWKWNYWSGLFPREIMK